MNSAHSLDAPSSLTVSLLDKAVTISSNFVSKVSKSSNFIIILSLNLGLKLFLLKGHFLSPSTFSSFLTICK